MKLEELVEQLKLAYGADLRAAVLYGSAVAGEHIAKRSDYNVLVIVESLPLSSLRAASAVARAWKESGHPAPMTFTLAEWRASADVFPMEYADILERNRVLFGQLPADGISVDRRDLRLQLEHEAMGKLLHIRKEAMGAGGDSGKQSDLLAASLSTVMVLFRAVTRLWGEAPSQDYEALTANVAGRCGLDPAPMITIIRHVRGTEKISKADAEAVLSGYLTALENFVRYLNDYAG
jgi:predicted nucleotidyltransferase